MSRLLASKEEAGVSNPVGVGVLGVIERCLRLQVSRSEWIARWICMGQYTNHDREMVSAAQGGLFFVLELASEYRIITST